jgi:hypothetical protein
MANLAKMKDDKQGNVASGPSDASMSTDPEIVRQAELETARERAATYEKRFRNVSRQVSRTKAAKERLEERLDAVQAEAAAQLSKAATTIGSQSSTIESLHDTIDSQSDSISDAQQRLKASESRISDLTKRVHKLNMRDVRAKAKAAGDDSSDEEESAGTFQVKGEQGIVTNDARALARDLVGLGVPASNVNTVIRTVAQPMGITVEGNISDRTVCCVVLEGGIAAQVQVVDEVHRAESA